MKYRPNYSITNSKMRRRNLCFAQRTLCDGSYRARSIKCTNWATKQMALRLIHSFIIILFDSDYFNGQLVSALIERINIILDELGITIETNMSLFIRRSIDHTANIFIWFCHIIYSRVEKSSLTQNPFCTKVEHARTFALKYIRCINISKA